MQRIAHQGRVQYSKILQNNAKQSNAKQRKANECNTAQGKGKGKARTERSGKARYSRAKQRNQRNEA